MPKRIYQFKITLTGITPTIWRCIDGARACPPEDCGGIYGYRHVLEVLANPDDDEHEEMLEWLGGKYDPETFSAAKVKFDNPE